MRRETYEYYLHQLPPVLQVKIQAYRNWQDAERSLAGYMLLVHGIKILGFSHYSLADLRYTSFNKPYFDDRLHFNITHSGNYTLLALSPDQPVGIDVEQVAEIPFGDFTEFFHEAEWQEVLDAPDPLHAFYSLWTKKEAFLKLVGSGLNTPLNQVVISNETIHWDNRELILQKIVLEPGHTCYLCTDLPAPAFTVSGVELNK
jgi:4'-phosphopantetheinyl transferase